MPSTASVAVDAAVVLVVALGALRGWRTGGVEALVRTVGLLLGLLLGLRAAGLLGGSLSPVAHLVLGVVCAAGGCVLGAAVGRWVGGTVAGRLRGSPVGVADRALGVVVRGGSAAVGCWLVAAVVVSLGPPAWARPVRGSALVADTHPLDGVARALRAAAPDDIAALVPADGTAPPAALVDAVGDRVGDSVLAVSATGCGQSVAATGFAVAGPGIVVTNAHVVRGATAISVETRAGRLTATPLVIDRRADLAVLHVDGLGAPLLVPAATDAANGAPAVVVGYPGGGPRTAIAAVVVARLPIPDPGLSDGLALHQTYRVRAAIRHGNSGSPLLDTSGRVIGVVNALSGTDTTQGYAITLDELRPDLAAARSTTTSVRTGSCAT